MRFQMRGDGIDSLLRRLNDSKDVIGCVCGVCGVVGLTTCARTPCIVLAIVQVASTVRIVDQTRWPSGKEFTSVMLMKHR